VSTLSLRHPVGAGSSQWRCHGHKLHICEKSAGRMQRGGWLIPVYETSWQKHELCTVHNW
jgi:hypothetical protein